MFTKHGEFLIQGWRVSTNGFKMLARFCGEFENNYKVLHEAPNILKGVTDPKYKELHAFFNYNYFRPSS